VSSEYASKEYTDQRRKYEEKVTKLKQILQEKEEEILAIKNKSQECNCINQVTTDALRAQLESLHRQLFFSLAVGIKLSLSMQVGYHHVCGIVAILLNRMNYAGLGVPHQYSYHV